MLELNAVAVFCGSSPGNQPAFTHAAKSLGYAICKSGKVLVYGGGVKGIMGTVSEAALEAGGKVIGVIPYAMVEDDKDAEIVDNAPINGNGGAPERTNWATLKARPNDRVETVVVDSMHERKVEMAKRAGGFVGLPGGFGTYEELLEVITWSQLQIHEKPVVLVNVLGFYNPLKDLIRSGIQSGFIQPQNEGLVIFVDGPSDTAAHTTYDWGQDVLIALKSWKRPEWSGYGFNWSKKLDGKSALEMS